METTLKFGVFEREKVSGEEELFAMFADKHFAERFVHNLNEDFEAPKDCEDYEFVIKTIK